MIVRACEVNPILGIKSSASEPCVWQYITPQAVIFYTSLFFYRLHVSRFRYVVTWLTTEITSSQSFVYFIIIMNLRVTSYYKVIILNNLSTTKLMTMTE